LAKFSTLKKYGEEIGKLLRVGSFPLALKMLREEGDIPKGVQRPKRDFGYRLATCQCLAMSRRCGTHIAQLKEDMWCFEPVVGYGLAKAPQYFLDGYNRFPETASTLEAGSNWANAFPHLEVGKYIGVISAPLNTANFEPDLVMVYCNAAQLTQLLMSVNWKDGYDINCRLSSHAACVYSVVLPLQNGEYQITSPCFGNRRRAIAQDDELLFTAPLEKVEDLIFGLKHISAHALGLPVQFTMMPEYELTESYAKIAGMLGMG